MRKKKFYLFGWLCVILSLTIGRQAFGASEDICRTVKPIDPSLLPVRAPEHVKSIPAGSFAINSIGTKASFEDLMRDDTIYFELPNGELANSYQWFYARLVKIGEGAYQVKSAWGTTYRVAVDYSHSYKVTVSYSSEAEGNYLTLECTLGQ